MGLQQFTNNARTTIAGGISTTATTINLASGTGAEFPSLTTGQYFVGTLVDAATGLLSEIVKVTGISTDALTVVRGWESTTARSWQAGDYFALLPTAGTLTGFAQPNDLQSQTTNYATDTGTANAMVITLTPAPLNLAALVGAPLRIKKGSSGNTGATTLVINGSTAISVLLPGGVTPGAGALPGSGILTLTYDGAVCEVQGGALNTGLGTAAYKNTSNNSDPYVAGVSGTPTAGHVAAFTDNIGTIGDGGALGTAAAKAASDGTQSNVASVKGTITAGNAAIFADTVGTVEDSGLLVPAAATNAQMESGTSGAVYPTPANVWLHPALPKAWVIYSGTMIVAAFNVSNVTVSGTTYTIHTQNLSLTAGFAVPTPGYGSFGGRVGGVFGSEGSGVNPTFTVQFCDAGGSGAFYNPSGYMFVAIYGVATN